MATSHSGRFYDNIRMTKPCFYALVDALTSRGLLPHGQTSRVSSIDEVALFMQTVGMHKRQRDNMQQFQHSLETINRRFRRVLSGLCAIAPELITRPNFTDTHSRVASNIDFYPYFKEGHWTLSVEQRLMLMIVDDNTRDSIRDDHRAEAHMAHWARGLRRHFGYHYTREQVYPLARRYYQYPEPHCPSMLEIWGPIRLPPIPVEGQSDARHNHNSNCHII
ncbi:hypothetical protein Sango_0817200 [Sesamum angolense]|uniref:DUF8040 domain-containing protein n=1 Tax=Sesamum angolense TaxID=2727404 RepID=A0AAE1X3K6_9LAMI|nr:hypothetical protein Sango_0817200 [Sesamum angolense]